jgi:hypothetical protein
MTLLSVADCCRRLCIDPKTFRHWLEAAHLSLSPHPTDGRSKGLPPKHLELLAAAHRRMLVPWPSQPEASPPTSREDAARASAPAPEPTLPASELLSMLLAQLSLMHEQLARLSHQLEPLVPPAVAGPLHPPALSQTAAALSPPAVRPWASDKQEAVQESRPRPPARVLPLVEYGRDGHYVLICPQEGRLSFEPDSPQWFAWLEGRSSFRGCREKRATSRRIGSPTACPTPSGGPIARSATSGWLTRLL